MAASNDRDDSVGSEADCSAWQLYDDLLAAVASDPLRNERICGVRQGKSWTMVETNSGLAGVAATQSGRSAEPLVAERYAGQSLSAAAELVRSWDLDEASVGAAAVNACLNRLERFAQTPEPDVFLRYRDRAAGKKVAVIGRFAYLEKRLKPICNLYVLERRPGAEDYPDSACEYLLPQMDVVFITGSTVANKTLPRLLTLSRHAFTIVSGPSTPMLPTLLVGAVDALGGFCVTDIEKCRQAVEGNASAFSCGTMVCLEAAAQ